jgi:hypothetical protein
LTRDRATGQQIAEMLEALETYIKLAVDIQLYWRMEADRRTSDGQTGFPTLK